jgi:hypothetical protein
MLVFRCPLFFVERYSLAVFVVRCHCLFLWRPAGTPAATPARFLLYRADFRNDVVACDAHIPAYQALVWDPRELLSELRSARAGRGWQDEAAYEVQLAPSGGVDADAAMNVNEARWRAGVERIKEVLDVARERATRAPGSARR